MQSQSKRVGWLGGRPADTWLTNELRRHGHELLPVQQPDELCASSVDLAVILLDELTDSKAWRDCLVRCRHLHDIPAIMLAGEGHVRLSSVFPLHDYLHYPLQAADVVPHVLAAARNCELRRQMRTAEREIVQLRAQLGQEGHGEDSVGLESILSSCDSSHEQMRLLTLRREEAREEERKRIARDLHDEMGQALSALRMDISLMRLRHAGQCDGLADDAANLMQKVDGMIEMVRHVATKLRPAVLDLGVRAAFEWQVDAFIRRYGIPCELQIEPQEPDIDPDRATVLFRIVQECLTNVVKHADASRVDICMQQPDGQYSLRIADNGRGFDPRQRNGKTWGLIGMRERVMMLHGDLFIQSHPGAGTAVEVRFPVDRTEWLS